MTNANFLFGKKPEPRFQPWVEAYASRRATIAPTAFAVFPTGRAELLFNFADPFLTGPEAGMSPLPSVALLGPRSRSYWHSAGPEVDWFFIQLTLVGLRRLLGIRFADCWDRVMPVGDLSNHLPPDLHAELRDAVEFDARIVLIEKWLECLEPVDCGGDPAVSEAVSLARDGRLSTVAELARHVGVGERRLRQRFGVEYGMAPKAFLQLIRLGRQLQSLHPGHPAERDVALDEFADESHAIRAFRRHTGLAPSAYRRIKEEGDSLVFTGKGMDVPTSRPMK